MSAGSTAPTSSSMLDSRAAADLRAASCQRAIEVTPSMPAQDEVAMPLSRDAAQHARSNQEKPVRENQPTQLAQVKRDASDRPTRQPAPTITTRLTASGARSPSSVRCRRRCLHACAADRTDEDGIDPALLTGSRQKAKPWARSTTKSRGRIHGQAEYNSTGQTPGFRATEHHPTVYDAGRTRPKRSCASERSARRQSAARTLSPGRSTISN